MTGAADVVAAVLEHLRADQELTVLDGEQEFESESSDLSQAGAGHIVLFSNLGALAAERLNRAQLQRTITFWIHSVGWDPSQARYLGSRAEVRMVGFRPTVPGFSFWPMTKEASSPIRLDRDARPIRHYGVDQYDLRSTHARITTTP